MRTTEKKIQVKFWKNSKVVCGRSSVLKFLLPGFHMLTKTKQTNKQKKIVKNQKLKISKIQNTIFVRTTQKKFQGKKFEKIQKCFEGGVAFQNFG